LISITNLQAEAFAVSKPISYTFFEITTEGEEVIANGSPEFRLFSAIPAEGGVDQKELMASFGASFKVAQGPCMKNKWIKLEKAEGKLYRAIESITDLTADFLKTIKAAKGDLAAVTDKNTITGLKRRTLIKEITLKSVCVSKGPNFALQRVKMQADLTKEMMDSGAWKTLAFKPYNFNCKGSESGGGYLHPTLKIRAEFRKILIAMGFDEMPTNQWVESSFWNFDALFQPQSHPARDMHDTFFMKSPKETLRVPEDYYERVKDMHEKGGECAGSTSIGYRYDFQRKEAFKNLLRTHTTSVSSAMLYKLANQPGGFTPAKYFSIDRVFRNETMDATHLAEFHQVEGLIADYDLSLGDLIGTIKSFFSAIGMTDIRFKPAFNPYTEPSMEIFAYHPTLKRTVEIGNSGIFRPEMLGPMGLPENVRVIAWGLALERPVMIKYGVQNIRDLFGHKCDFQRTVDAPLPILDR
jgi:phenylalanyl-tRNA synthetase alpha chain